MLIYLISKLKATKYNILFLSLFSLPVGYGFGYIVTIMYYKFLYSTCAQGLMVLIVLAGHLYVSRLFFIELCKFLLKRQYKN